MEGKKQKMLAFIVGATIAVTNGARLTGEKESKINLDAALKEFKKQAGPAVAAVMSKDMDKIL